MANEQTQQRGFFARLWDFVNPNYPFRERREAKKATELREYAMSKNAQLKAEIKEMQEKGSSLTPEERTQLHRKMYQHEAANGAVHIIMGQEREAVERYEQRIKDLHRPSSPRTDGDARAKGSRVREEYLEGEPQVIANFMRNFQPQNDNEKSRFNYLVDQLESGKSLKSHYFVLADIGYGDVLGQLYKDCPDRYSVRSRVMGNPHCPESVLAEGLKDDHPLVRKAAVENQNLSQMLVYNHARQEQDPAVKEALEKRLGKENYQAATQGISGTRSRFENPVKSKKPSLDAQINGAKAQHEAQLAAFQKVKEQGAVIGGTAKAPFVPTR